MLNNPKLGEIIAEKFGGLVFLLYLCIVKSNVSLKPNRTMNNINKNIEGYEMVKNVVEALGWERCGCTHLFAVKRGSGCGGGKEGLDGIVAVSEDTSYENYKRLQEQFPFEDYIIWYGTIRPKYNRELHRYDETQKVIDFYWS